MVQRAGRRHGFQVAAAAFLFAAGCGSSAPATGDPCAALDCGTHGTCTDAGGTARCECAAGFTASRKIKPTFGSDNGPYGNRARRPGRSWHPR